MTLLCRYQLFALGLGLSTFLAIFAPGCVNEETQPNDTPENGSTPLAESVEAPEAFDIDHETVGELRLGLSGNQVRAILSGEPQKGEDVFWGASGEYGQEWNYAAHGIVLQMMSLTSDGEKAVGSITIKAPSTLRTRRGIEIGSPEADVLKAYGPFRAQDSEGFTEPGRSFVAGSIFGGLVFTISAGMVSEIFLGAAAE